jgi:hypothetical protein
MQKSLSVFIILIFLLNICSNANPFLKKHYSQFKESLDELKNKNFDNALSEIDNAIITAEKDNLPDSDILRYNRGIFNIMAGKPDNAIVDFENSLKSGIYNDDLIHIFLKVNLKKLFRTTLKVIKSILKTKIF